MRNEARDLPVLLDRYRLLRPIGQGGFGSVFLAEDTMLDGRLVAIKISSGAWAKDPSAVESVKAEAKLAMELSHPHIATMRAFERDGDRVFLVMDYVAGCSLQDLVDRGSLGHERVRTVIASIADALSHAHDKGLVHRDLKPANILLDESGHPFLTDFGIASMRSDARGDLDAAPGIAGTLPYMSPQHLLGEPPCPQHDIYGLAATAYCCLTGHPPFFRGDIQSQILHCQPSPIPGTPRDLSQLILRALSKSEELRPSSMRELRDRLQPEEYSTVESLSPSGLELVQRAFPVTPAQDEPAATSGWGRLGEFEVRMLLRGGLLRGARLLPSVEDHATGQRWYKVKKGQIFELEVTNRSHRRIVAVVAVDGINVLTRETCGLGSRGYVVEPNTRIRIDGWNVDDTASEKFTFAPRELSEAAGSDDPRTSVGVIGVAFISERVHVPRRRMLEPTPSDRPTEAVDRITARFAPASRYDPSMDLGVGRGERVARTLKTVRFRRAELSDAVVVTVRYAPEGAVASLGCQHHASSASQWSRLDSEGYSRLHHAALHGDLQSVSRGLELGVDPNLRAYPLGGERHIRGVTPLHIAAARDDGEIVRRLLAGGASINACTEAGWNPLHIACSTRYHEYGARPALLRLLVAAGLDVNTATPEGHNALHNAASFLQPEHLSVLLQCGASLTMDREDVEGDTPVDSAVVFKKWVNADYLSTYGASSKDPVPCLGGFDAAEALASAWNTGDFSGLESVIARDVVYRSDILDLPIDGLDSVVAYFRAKWEELSQPGSSDRVYAEVGCQTDGSARRACVISSHGRPGAYGTVLSLRRLDYGVHDIASTGWQAVGQSVVPSGWFPTPASSSH